MEQIVIKKPNGVEIPLFKSSPLSAVTSALQSVALFSEDNVRLTAESIEPINVSKNDTINIFGKAYRLNQTPTETKSSSNRFTYDLTFESIMYDLRKPQWMLPASVGFASVGDEPLTTDLKGFADILIYNANRVLGAGKWVLGVYPAGTEFKTLAFPGEKLLSVLQKLCQEYGTEFEIKTNSVTGVTTIDFKQAGNILTDTFKFGRGNELYSIQRANSSKSDVVTRLFAFGSTKNLKSGYRNYSNRLRLSVNADSYIQDSSIVNPETEIIEFTKYFEDVFQQRTGTVIALFGDNLNAFVDSSMDFDLNEEDSRCPIFLCYN